jgi:mannan endo-1,4-beta-mannosidase
MEVWRNLTTPGSELFKKWQKGVDRISSHLAILKEQKIPVLWRPYHEMNGTWFWWCDKKGKDGFARLWKQLYERMVDYHKLDNLIWVWNANAPRNIPGDEAYDYEDYFPGHDYVDVLAADVYKNDYKRSHHDQLLELAQSKPISLAEVGELPNPEKLDSQQEWTWFMTWGNFIIDANDEEKVKEVYEHELVLSLNDVTKNDNGEWMLNQYYQYFRGRL